MKLILISVFDKKASAYGAPLCYEHVTQALRSYISFARQKPDAMQVQFCEDYDLYQVGEFDQISGAVTPMIPPQYLESMINLVAESKPKGGA